MPSKKNESKSVKIKIVPDPEMVLSYPRLYANYAAIQSSPFDFTIRFCDALPIYNLADNGPTVLENRIPIVAEIVLPVNVFPSLIEAMQVHYAQYIKTHGNPQKDEKKK